LKHNKLAIIILILSHSVFSQKVKELSYPKGYFIFPIRPGLTNHLSGAMGDLRAAHFHGGLDIKTEQRIGLPVYAAADGYISEIRVTTGGYGNGLFIKHPNGMMTVYGHLDSFEGEIGEYATLKRYEKQSFEISIKPEINELPVKKGDIIALSGNTGGSGGPHLHFEIRNENNNILNPLYFDFQEITDYISPQLQGLLIKPLAINARVNERFGRQYFYPQKIGNSYQIKEPIYAKGQIGLELLAYDKMNFNNNSYGISCIEMFVNGQESFYFHLEKIPVEDSKDINVHIDYALEKTIGKKYQRLNKADGNNDLPIYKPTENTGKLNIEPGKTYDIEIKAWDSYENLSKLKFQILGDTASVILETKPTKIPENIDYQVDENTLIINLNNCKSPETICELGINGKSEQLKIQYISNNKATYLYDLRKGLPQFIEIGDLQQPLNFSKIVPSNKNIDLKAGNFELRFRENSLYDTLFLELIDRKGAFQIGQSTIPLKEPFEISYKTNGNFDTNKSHVYNIYGNATKLQNTSWNGNNLTFKARELGNYSILTDNIAPNIKPLIKNSEGLVFRISDELSGIKNFRAEVNGQYVLMDYDYKKKQIWSIKADTSVHFLGELKLLVSDNAGNEAAYESLVEEPLPVERKVKTTKKGKKAQAKSKKSTKKAIRSKTSTAKKKKRK
jgi:Peptidase family M23